MPMRRRPVRDAADQVSALTAHSHQLLQRWEDQGYLEMTVRIPTNSVVGNLVGMVLDLWNRVFGTADQRSEMPDFLEIPVRIQFPEK